MYVIAARYPAGHPNNLSGLPAVCSADCQVSQAIVLAMKFATREMAEEQVKKWDSGWEPEIIPEEELEDYFLEFKVLHAMGVK